MSSENTAGRHRCPIAGREAVQVCSATTHTAPARDPWNRRGPHDSLGKKIRSACQVFRRDTHTHMRKHAPSGLHPLGSWPSSSWLTLAPNQPGRRDDGDGDGGEDVDGGLCVAAPSLHNASKEFKRCVGGRMGEPSCAVRRCESVCCRPWSCSKASRELTSASPTGSWHAACAGLGQYYVHLACIYREGRLPVLHALPADLRGLNTQRPRALVLQPKGVMEQSTDMIPPPHAWRHLPVPFFPVPPNARTTGTGADRERGWRWQMEHGWRGVRSDASKASPHISPTPHHKSQQERDSDRERHLVHLGSPFPHGFCRSRDNAGASCKVDELDWQQMDRRSPINFVTARRGPHPASQPGAPGVPGIGRVRWECAQRWCCWAGKVRSQKVDKYRVQC